MNFRKCVQKLGAHLSCSKPRHGGLRIKTGKDVAVSNAARSRERISHDGRPWPLKTPSNDVDDVGSPERYDVVAVVLLHDVCFEALYDYTSHTLAVSGKVSGKIAIVRLDMIIGHPQGPDGAPEVILFEVTEYTRVGISKQSVGVLNEKIINEVTEKVVHTCIEDAMSYRVLPVLNSALKVIPYPNFT
ncbi:uncharacterized protein LOC119387150 [Rhipicephalus sanguineus]|uniref:Uncharacterized protein n=1 Tax=Rhipicephalus sanguineus TaxID=34632 RepID=A0A9D4QJ56_RHISA|nr:uncharacterized protein LOC119387150 [Rhipicephalus sanguineus]KAH7982346.1 hypothetical protein HPB52_004150 [Rhipicephalus sanguineus]